MPKPMQRKSFKNKQNVVCEQCIHCVYVEHGDMYCNLTRNPREKSVKWMYENFVPTEDYMICQGKKFYER